MADKKMSIADTEEYKEFEMKHNRHLNMLADSVSFIIVFLNLFFRTVTFEDKH